MRIALRSRFTRRAAALLAIAAATTVAACNSDRALGPNDTNNASIVSRNSSVKKGLDLVVKSAYAALPSKQALMRDTAFDTPVSRSLTVTSAAGGDAFFADLGLYIYVPAGAIDTPSMTITVVALPGRAVAYEFYPEGTHFLTPISLEQDLKGTSLAGAKNKGRLGAGYFKDAAQVNPLTGLVYLNEVLWANWKSNRVQWDVNHFSGYMVSMD